MLRFTRLVALCAALALAGCGDDEADAPRVDLRPETIDPLPKLPRGFEPYLSRSNGLMLGRPPGWRAEQDGITTVLRAPDELVVMTLSADRTDEAVGGAPESFAVRTFAALPGYEGDLDPSEPRPFPHSYEAFTVEGRGVALASGVPQRLQLVVLKRPGMAVVTAVIAENARVGARAEARQAIKALRTLRTRPVSRPFGT